MFSVSFSALFIELYLVRFFSITQWNHLSFMVITIALLGYAISGTMVALSAVLGRRRLRGHTISAATVLCGISTVAGAFLVLRLPLDYFRLPVDPWQIAYLALTVLLLAFPFFFAGLATSALYVVYASRARLAYSASMLGSACGAALAPLLLSLPTETLAVATAASVPILVGGAALRRKIPRCLGIAAGVATLLGAVLLPSLLDSAPSPYKGLSQLLRYPQTRITATRRSIYGRIDEVHTPFLRHAPGLSLTFSETVPSHDAVFLNGDAMLLLPRPPIDTGFAARTHPYAGYVVAAASGSAPQSVLVLEQDGGVAPLCALAAGASRIALVVSTPPVARVLRGAYRSAPIDVVTANPRGVLASSTDEWDVVHIDLWGSSLPGMDSLDQQFLLTTDAFLAGLGALNDTGVLITSRLLLTPPSGILRILGAAWEAARLAGLPEPSRHLLILRNWDSYTLSVTSSPVTASQVEAFTAFADANRFDPVYFPGMSREDANRYNVFATPLYADAVAETLRSYEEGRERERLRLHPLDIEPQRDSRPYPSRFLRWTGLEISRGGKAGYRLITSGEIVVPAVLALSLVFSGAALGVPLLVARRRRAAFSGVSSPRVILYFAAIGLGFMFCEMSLLKTMALLHPNPTTNLAIVVLGVTVSSGAGALLSGRVDLRPARVFLGIALGFAALLALASFTLGPLTRALLSAPEGLRLAAALLITCVLSLPLGIFLPLGMSRLAPTAHAKGLGWAANGAASVLASVLSVMLAMGVGVPWVMVAASCCYACGTLTLGFRASGIEKGTGAASP